MEVSPIDRRSFLNCALFDSLSHREISLLLGCVGARYRRMLGGTSMYTDRIIVVLSGELLMESRHRRAGAVLVSAGKSRYVAATTQSELFLIDDKRLLAVCGNSCAIHRTALINFVRICQEQPIIDHAQRIAKSGTAKDKHPWQTYISS